jgi:hypothetical protein
MLLDPLGTEALERGQGLQGLRRAAGQFHGLTVVAEHEGRHPLDAGGLPSPLENPVVAGPLRLVELREHRLQRGRTLLLLLLGIDRPRLRPLEQPGLEVDRPIRSAAVNEELRLRTENLPIREVLPQRRIVEQTRGRVPPYRQDSCLNNRHGSTHCK